MNAKYKEYLVSDKWLSFRKSIIDTHKCCCVCRRENVVFNVHHKHYRNIFNETRNDVVLLCRECHDLVHEMLKDAGKLRNRHRYTGRMMRQYKKHSKNYTKDYSYVIRIVRSGLLKQNAHRKAWQEKKKLESVHLY